MGRLDSATLPSEEGVAAPQELSPWRRASTWLHPWRATLLCRPYLTNAVYPTPNALQRMLQRWAGNWPWLAEPDTAELVADTKAALGSDGHAWAKPSVFRTVLYWLGVLTSVLAMITALTASNRQVSFQVLLGGVHLVLVLWALLLWRQWLFMRTATKHAAACAFARDMAARMAQPQPRSQQPRIVEYHIIALYLSAAQELRWYQVRAYSALSLFVCARRAQPPQRTLADTAGLKRPAAQQQEEHMSTSQQPLKSGVVACYRELGHVRAFCRDAAQLAAQTYGFDDATAQAGAELAEARLCAKPAKGFIAASIIYCIAIVYIVMLPQLHDIHGRASDADTAIVIIYAVRIVVLCLLGVLLVGRVLRGWVLRYADGVMLQSMQRVKHGMVQGELSAALDCVVAAYGCTRSTSGPMCMLQDSMAVQWIQADTAA